MNPTIKNNEHIHYIKDLPNTMALYKFINTLNKKYELIDDNFGIIYPNQITRDEYNNTLLKLMKLDSEESIHSLTKTIPEISNKHRDKLFKLRSIAKKDFINKLTLLDFAIGKLPLFKKTFDVPPASTDYGTKGKFIVEYTGPLDNLNLLPHFITSYKCNKSSGQAQEDMNHNHMAYTFYKKWKVLHRRTLTIPEWNEMYADLSELEKYCMDES